MKTLTVKDAKYFLGRLIDLARAFGGSGAMIASASHQIADGVGIPNQKRAGSQDPASTLFDTFKDRRHQPPDKSIRRAPVAPPCLFKGVFVGCSNSFSRSTRVFAL
jgi:hypothetical protein